MNSTTRGFASARRQQQQLHAVPARAQARRPPPTSNSSSSRRRGWASLTGRGGYDVAKSSPAGRNSSASSSSPASSPMAPLPSAAAASSSSSSSPSSRGAAAAARQPMAPTPPHQPSRPAPGVLRVAIDVDEVLGRFLHKLNEFCKDEYGLDVDISDYHVYEFAKVWGCSRDASNEIVHAFFDSRHFADGIEPIPGAAEALRKTRDFGASLAVVTSRQHVIRQPTLDWLDAHFGLPLFDAGVHFGNHWALEGKSTSKSQLCDAIGASVLVDDNPGYAAECADAGMKVLLYDWQGAYPWAKPPPAVGEHPNVEVVRDWGDVERALREIATEVAAADNSGGNKSRRRNDA